MTETTEKCEAILKRMLEMIDNSGESVRLEYDFGDYTATVYDGLKHTHVGIPGDKTADTWKVFVDNLYNALHGGPGLSWFDPSRLYWTPISQEPTCKYVLLSGKYADGRWRDVGVYLGNGDYTDKYSDKSNPTHWMPLPDPLDGWTPISQEPDDDLGNFFLIAGKRSDGEWWRDVGVYCGDGEFRDKYSADTHPTHWMQLPDPPKE